MLSSRITPTQSFIADNEEVMNKLMQKIINSSEVDSVKQGVYVAYKMDVAQVFLNAAAL